MPTLAEECLESFHSLATYYPYKTLGELNPKCDNFSRRLMDLKNPDCPGHISSIPYFEDAFYKFVKARFGTQDPFQIAVVPSSTAGKISSGLETLINTLQGKLDNYFYDREYLARIKSISPAHSGGTRSTQVHLQSVRVGNTITHNRPCLLLDDVATTKSSMKACYSLLRQANVNTIICLALGETE